MNTMQATLDNSLAAYRRDRILVIAGIVILSLLAWLYLLVSASSAHVSEHTAMPQPSPWSLSLLPIGMLMWSVMMMAMMLPTATPMVLSYLRAQRHRHPDEKALQLTWMLIGGYLLSWTAFSVLAALAGWALHGMGLLSGPMGSVAPLLTGGFLVTAGIFQWSGLKDACLTKCRSPMNFLLNHWREGSGGALVMGVHHGAYCVGCCWMLMLLMFLGGVMNLAWMAAIAIYVLAEKIAPGMRLFGRLAGAVLALVGLLWLGQALTA